MQPDDAKTKAKDIVDDVGSSAEGASQQMRAAAEAIKDHASDLAARGRGAVEDVAASAQQTLHDAVDRLPKTAADAAGLGGQIYARGNAEVSRHVRKQPIEALLLAGAIGFLVGWAANRS